MDIRQWKERFTYPVLPAPYEKEIQIHIVDHLPSPGGMEHRVPGMVIYETDTEEWRIYGISEREAVEDFIPEIVSCYSHHDQVDVFINQDWWKENHKRFCPWFYIHLEELLLENQALILHSASITHKDHALLFTAPGGTGKTTQTDLWHRYLEDVEDLNGDRTLLQCTPNGWYACGFPICGSSGRCEQKTTPIRAVIILRQGTEDKIYELSPAQKTALLYSEVTVPHFQRTSIERTLELLEDFIREIPVFLYSCTMQESAVTTLHHYLYGGTEDGII